ICRRCQAPVQMQFRFRTTAVDESAARCNHDGCRTEHLLEHLPRLRWLLIAFDAEREAEHDILLSRAVLAVEGCDRRAGHRPPRRLRRPPCPRFFATAPR